MYKHWRYKPIATGHAYPFYAQESPFFEQIASRANYAKLDRPAALERRAYDCFLEKPSPSRRMLLVKLAAFLFRFVRGA